MQSSLMFIWYYWWWFCLVLTHAFWKSNCGSKWNNIPGRQKTPEITDIAVQFVPIVITCTHTHYRKWVGGEMHCCVGVYTIEDGTTYIVHTCVVVGMLAEKLESLAASCSSKLGKCTIWDCESMQGVAKIRQTADTSTTTTSKAIHVLQTLILFL